MTKPLVIVPHVEGMLREETREAVRRQWPEAILLKHPDADGWGYPDLLRDLWRRKGDLVICEQDNIPPPGAIQRLLECPGLWCCHRQWITDRYQVGTLGLAKFSAYLKYHLPNLADSALAPYDGRVYTRLGWTDLDQECSEATLERFGRKACLRPDVDLPRGPDGRVRWPSTIPRRTADTALRLQLEGAQVPMHIHEPPTVHLHFQGFKARDRP